jgi:hypothetical protein
VGRLRVRGERCGPAGRVDQSWTPDLRAAKFKVVSINGGNAHVRLEVPGAYGPIVEFSLSKTAHGWRIDDSDAVPSGY